LKSLKNHGDNPFRRKYDNQVEIQKAKIRYLCRELYVRVSAAAGLPGLISPKEGGGGAVNGDNLTWAEFLPLKLISDMIFNLKNIICNLISHLN
jgi:hypothetical protein